MRGRAFGLAALVLAFACGTSHAEDRRVDTSRLTIMTFNGEFLWDGVEPEEGNVEFSWKGSPDEAEEHMAKVAAVIRAANPDIVNMVEVEGIEALEILNTKFLAGLNYRAYLVKGKDFSTGQDVGFLTRVDPENNRVDRHDEPGVSGNTRKSVSKNYYARFQVGQRRFSIIGVHFLARPDDPGRKPDRQAQADAIANLGAGLARQNYPPIVLGDFNDYEGEEACKDHVDSTPITNVLSRVRQLNRTTEDDDLGNVLCLIPKGSRYSAHWDRNRNSRVDRPGELTAIDHILLPKALYGLVQSASIIDGHDPLDVSDHFPVVVTLNLGGADTTPATTGTLRIASAIPNPSGDERQNEQVTIANVSKANTMLAGWKVRDLSGKELALTGQLAAGQAVVVKRSGAAITLNNNGDTLELVSPQGTVVHSVTYGYADPDEELTFYE